MKLVRIFFLITIPNLLYAELPAKAQSMGCVACHSLDAKLVGPSFKEIATFYKGDAKKKDILVAKVMAGGVSETWKAKTNGIAMPPHPHLKKEDIGEVVVWLLSLSK